MTAEEHYRQKHAYPNSRYSFIEYGWVSEKAKISYKIYKPKRHDAYHLTIVPYNIWGGTSTCLGALRAKLAKARLAASKKKL